MTPRQSRDLRQKPDEVVLVTGAAGAIGSATVEAFLGAGFGVVGLDRDPAVEADRHPAYHGLAVDLRDEQLVAEAMHAVALAGQLMHVVSTAGGALPIEPSTQHDPTILSTADFRASVELNLTTHFVVVREALPLLGVAGGRDRSVTLTSSFNALGGWGMPAYSAAKAGLIGMMQALTGPLGAAGIRINVVAPGTIRTPRTARIWAGDPDHFARLERTTALGRLGTPDDVAATFLAIASAMRHVTGQVIVVDGGQSTKRDWNRDDAS